jgi:hypothetical protein
MKNESETASANLRPYRVTIQSTDWYEVDVLAPDEVAAKCRAECIDADYITRRVDGEWKATDAWELTAQEFDPPDLPASAWIA